MSQSLVGTPGTLGNDLWNEQKIEGGDLSPKLRGPQGVNSTKAAAFLKDQTTGCDQSSWSGGVQTRG